MIEVHDSHRQRVKSKFLSAGLDVMHDHEALELLLFYAIPRRDVNPNAHALMERFRSLSAVMEATPQELQEVSGIGENAATLIHLCMEMSRRYGIDKERQCNFTGALTTTDSICAYMQPRFEGMCDEVFLIACLDSRCMVQFCGVLARGSVNMVHVSIRKTVEVALQHHATSVILAHNHPSGLALPSCDDIATTKRIYNALRIVEIQLLDHVIVADGDSVSLRDSGMLHG